MPVGPLECLLLGRRLDRQQKEKEKKWDDLWQDNQMVGCVFLVQS